MSGGCCWCLRDRWVLCCIISIGWLLWGEPPPPHRSPPPRPPPPFFTHAPSAHVMMCCCTQHCCQPSWSTPTQCIHCGAQAVQSEWTGAKLTGGGLWFFFSTVLSCILKPTPPPPGPPSVCTKGITRGLKSRRRWRRRGHGSLSQDSSVFHSVVARRRGGCRLREEEKQHPFKHLLRAAVGLAPSLAFYALCLDALFILSDFLFSLTSYTLEPFTGSWKESYCAFFPRWCCFFFFCLALAESSCLIWRLRAKPRLPPPTRSPRPPGRPFISATFACRSTASGFAFASSMTSPSPRTQSRPMKVMWQISSSSLSGGLWAQCDLC